MQIIIMALYVIAVPLAAPRADLAAGGWVALRRQTLSSAIAGPSVITAASALQLLGFVLDQLGYAAMVVRYYAVPVGRWTGAAACSWGVYIAVATEQRWVVCRWSSVDIGCVCA